MTNEYLHNEHMALSTVIMFAVRKETHRETAKSVFIRKEKENREEKR